MRTTTSLLKASVLSLLTLPLTVCQDGDQAPPAQEAPTLPAWERALPSSELGVGVAQRGLQVVRGIIHLHSTYSHDACDNDPLPGGLPNAPCWTHLREGLCQTLQDFGMLTDHSAHMATTSWEKLFVQEPGDLALMQDGGLVGSRLRCNDKTGMAGHEVVLTAGGENSLMPVGLTRHVGANDAERSANMSDGSPAAVTRFREAGAVVLVAHGESHPIDELRGLAAAGLGGMEVYNLHANIDPRIRGDYLGLEPFGAINGLAPWLAGKAVEDGGPEPDLALLGFLEENQNQIGKFDTLLGEGRHLTAIIGSDSHENTVKQTFPDGERGDSYRRLMRWFSNHLLLPRGEVTPAALKDALARGRSYGAFEIFGSPRDFQFFAEAPAGVAEMGDTVTAGATLHVLMPRLTLPAGTRDAPVVRLRLLRVAPGATAAVEVATGTGAEIKLAAAAPGAYRAEVRVVPRHLLPLLGQSTARYMKEFPYIYTSPIYVAP